MEWFEFHSREAMWVVIGLVVIAGGVWFYQKSQAAQAKNAAGVLAEAEQAVSSGNLPLAQADFERLVKRWPGTSSGKVGVYLLAQVHYQKGEFQQGVDALKPLIEANDALFTAGAMSLTAAGLEQLHKYLQAADMYKQAAAKSTFESDRATNMSSAARALGLAGKTDEAKAIFHELAADPSGAASAEARVRLGEMDAKVAN